MSVKEKRPIGSQQFLFPYGKKMRSGTVDAKSPLFGSFKRRDSMPEVHIVDLSTSPKSQGKEPFRKMVPESTENRKERNNMMPLGESNKTFGSIQEDSNDENDS